MRTWAHGFDQPGIYVFADSKDSSKLTVIAAKAANEACLDPGANIQSMTADSLSAVGIAGQDKQVRPNWSFIIGTFVVLLSFNFGIVGLFVYLGNRAQMKLASGDGAGGTIYYDKVANQEDRDRQQRSCLSCLSAGVNRLSSKLAQEDGEKPEQLLKGPKYDDLVKLLSDFKSEYEVLRTQLQNAQEAQNATEDAEELRHRREEELLDERIQALKDLKEFVRENQSCLRDYLGLDEANGFGGESGPLDPLDRDDGYVDPVAAGKRLVLKSEKQEQDFARAWEDQTREAQENAIQAELEENERLRREAITEFRSRMRSDMNPEDSQALLGEIQGKLGSIDALLEGEGAAQSKLLSDAMERRRKRRAGMHESVDALAEKQQAHSEKFSRKLKVIKAQELEDLRRVEVDMKQEHEEAAAEIAKKIETEKERRVSKLQKDLQDFNRKNAGAQGELAFGEKLSQYKDQVADLEGQLEKDKARQLADLEERLRKRRAARVKKVEDDAKEREMNVIEDMQDRG